MSAIYCKGLNLIKNPGLIGAYKSHSAHQFSDFVCKNASRSLSTIIGGMVCGWSFHNSTHWSNWRQSVYQLFPNQILLIDRRPCSSVKWCRKVWAFTQSRDLLVLWSMFSFFIESRVIGNLRHFTIWIQSQDVDKVHRRGNRRLSEFSKSLALFTLWLSLWHLITDWRVSASVEISSQQRLINARPFCFCFWKKIS